MEELMIIDKYFSYLHEHLDKMEMEKENIISASDLIVESIKNGGKMYVFGFGHSHIMWEEIYMRAGGLALVHAILPPELMTHEMPNKSMYMERLEGNAEAILTLYKVDAKDTIVIISNSDRNAVTVEMAMKAKEIGCKVIVMTL